ncbi:LacI family DNA-binding transcriptional regulator [Altererythrobacter ishigakiensis]|uniref:LacI family transcriptional regulator n=1 Tax=Altererythrobacter ishigakiensis TaxID=476157 RepID=A0A562UUM6_9SPHN|nr:LacI family DNA-binding transcriptional regulator [Altererythrobacter ishigakiensis]TWJ09344.1 LacI family transcriptional regulator [Altererythrobacter ishigakiensis]
MDTARKPMRVTSFDVAEKAGVSQSTVSRALSGSAVITEATRNRVLEAASELGYFVDERAARLRRGHTGTLAAVVICKPGYSARDVNPFSYALLGGICAAAADRGLEVLVSLQADEEKLFGHYVERGQAEGLIVIGTTANREAWDYFRKIGETTEPVAYWGSPLGDLDWVSSDNEAGARLAAEHLADRGCNNLVCIGSHSSVQRQFAERTDAFEARAKELGKEADLIAIEPGKERREQGRLAAQALIASGKSFDGVFAVCDAIAFGVLEAFQSAGIAMPGKVKVVGFDGIPAGELSNPPLTTIEPDLDQAGRLLVEAVTAGEAAEHPSVRRVPVRLLERASS